MKKTAVLLIFITMLTLTAAPVFFGGREAAFADEESADNSETQTVEAEDESYTDKEIITAVATYGIFVLALAGGISLLRKANRRKKLPPSTVIEKALRDEAAQLRKLSAAQTDISARALLKRTVTLSVIADKILSAYTDGRTAEYLEFYNRVLAAREMLSTAKKGNTRTALDGAAEILDGVARGVSVVADSEIKISKYNKEN